MTILTQTLERLFRYNSVDLIDPGMQYTPEQVRDFYSPTYPEILNAAIEGPEEKDGKVVYTFRRAVGTKGAARVQPSDGVALIGIERLRQRLDLGYGEAHDDDHTDNSLSLAAVAYAAPEPLYRRTREIHQGGQRYADVWPTTWDRKYDKRKWVGERPARANEMVDSTRIRQLTVAGALIAAEIDRLLRLQAAQPAKAKKATRR